MNEQHITNGAHQHRPLLYIDGLGSTANAHTLAQLSFTHQERRHDEAWLQRLVFHHPQLLPVHEIEPGFGRILPVCMELPTPAGVADILYVTPRGDLVLVECKLWRNPEARRQVVAQIIDYAQALASWRYEHLEEAIRKAGMADDAPPPASLYGLVQDQTEIDEAEFVDAVSRNLRLGRMLLLIVGDGIREGVESLSDYLQKHAGFHFTLGIAEMSVFEAPQQSGFIVQPRVLARTVNIERGIVRLADDRVQVQPPPSDTRTARAGVSTSISRDRLMEILAELSPELPAAFDSVASKAADLGVVVSAARKSLNLRWMGPDDKPFPLGGVNDSGELITYNVNWSPNESGHIDLAHDYLERVAQLIGCEVRRTAKPDQWYVSLPGEPKYPPAMLLLARQNEWLAIMDDYIRRLKAAVGQEA